MKRVQLFEFEDFNWFPSSLRSGVTNLIVVLQKFIGNKEVIANAILEVKKQRNFSQIVDMGSGSGGIMPEVLGEIKRNGVNDVKLLLTDLHPNPKFMAHVNSEGGDIRYHATSLDASNLSSAPEGLKTMINCFHHMPPKKAREILQSVQDNNESILIYEMTENKIPLLLWWLFLPLSLVILMIMSLFLTPFSRPLTFQQLFFTYIIPVIPIFYAWDGQASMPRIYTFQDIEELLPDAQEGFSWKIEKGVKKDGKNQGYYIVGMPKKEI